MIDEIAVFDLDGTLADDRHRRDLIDWECTDFEGRFARYHSLGEFDALINRHLIDHHLAQGHRIAFATARPVKYLEMTDYWLREYLPDLTPHNLAMRGNNDQRSSPELKLDMVRHFGCHGNVIVVYDDREDVCEHLGKHGYSATLITTCGSPLVAEAQSYTTPTAKTLLKMAKTFEEKNAVYKDNWRNVPAVLKALFPDGVSPELLEDPCWFLFERKLVKLARFAATNFTHVDSIHDDAIYSAMIESILTERNST